MHIQNAPKCSFRFIAIGNHVRFNIKDIFLDYVLILPESTMIHAKRM